MQGAYRHMCKPGITWRNRRWIRNRFRFDFCFCF